MTKFIYLLMLAGGLAACNNPQREASENGGDSSSLIENDTAGDARGARGSGSENSGGTPGPGTITDTVSGKTDTQDHRSGAIQDSVIKK